MQLRKATRKQVKMKLQIGATAGGGKSVGALRMAYGLCPDWGKIAVIDTENESAALYVNSEQFEIGEFQHLSISNFKPDEYIKAIDICVKAGMEVVIIDSATPVWEWCVAYHSKLSGNSFQNWGLVLSKYNAYKNAMLQAPVHIISTVRKKEEHVLEEVDRGGKKKMEVVKKGLKTIERNEMSYEFTTVFDVDAAHLTTVSKDRTGLFTDETPFLITQETGKLIKEWCGKGEAIKLESKLTTALDAVRACANKEELTGVLNEFKELLTEEDFKTAVKTKRDQL